MRNIILYTIAFIIIIMFNNCTDENYSVIEDKIFDENFKNYKPRNCEPIILFRVSPFKNYPQNPPTAVNIGGSDFIKYNTDHIFEPYIDFYNYFDGNHCDREGDGTQSTEGYYDLYLYNYNNQYKLAENIYICGGDKECIPNLNQRINFRIPDNVPRAYPYDLLLRRKSDNREIIAYNKSYYVIGNKQVIYLSEHYSQRFNQTYYYDGEPIIIRWNKRDFWYLNDQYYSNIEKNLRLYMTKNGKEVKYFSKLENHGYFEFTPEFGSGGTYLGADYAIKLKGMDSGTSLESEMFSFGGRGKPSK